MQSAQSNRPKKNLENTSCSSKNCFRNQNLAESAHRHQSVIFIIMFIIISFIFRLDFYNDSL